MLNPDPLTFARQQVVDAVPVMDALKDENAALCEWAKEAQKALYYGATPDARLRLIANVPAGGASRYVPMAGGVVLTNVPPRRNRVVEFVLCLGMATIVGWVVIGLVMARV